MYDSVLEFRAGYSRLLQQQCSVHLNLSCCYWGFWCFFWIPPGKFQDSTYVRPHLLHSFKSSFIYRQNSDVVLCGQCRYVITWNRKLTGRSELLGRVTEKRGQMRVTYFWSTDFCTYCTGWLCCFCMSWRMHFYTPWWFACNSIPVATDTKHSHRQSLPHEVFRHVETQHTAVELTPCSIYAWTAYRISWFYEACIESTVEMLRCKSHVASWPRAVQFFELICSCQNASSSLLICRRHGYRYNCMGAVSWCEHDESRAGRDTERCRSVSSDYEDCGTWHRMVSRECLHLQGREISRKQAASRTFQWVHWYIL